MKLKIILLLFDMHEKGYILYSLSRDMSIKSEGQQEINCICIDFLGMNAFILNQSVCNIYVYIYFKYIQ